MNNPASELAKKRWGKLNGKERSEEMRKVAFKGWITRRKNKKHEKD